MGEVQSSVSHRLILCSKIPLLENLPLHSIAYCSSLAHSFFHLFMSVLIHSPICSLAGMFVTHSFILLSFIHSLVH